MSDAVYAFDDVMVESYKNNKKRSFDEAMGEFEEFSSNRKGKKNKH